MTLNPKNKLAHGGYLLIAANSGRMLAKAAHDAGYLPLVVDLCADQDTQHCAVEAVRIPEFNYECLISAINNFKAKYSVSSAVYGSGFENCKQGLELLAANFTLLGNSVEVFSALCDKAAFFTLLKRLTIPFPATQFHFPPENSLHWLFKPEHGCGGAGIVNVNNKSLVNLNGYWQKYQTGVPHSALFLADGKRGRIIGFNEQWTIKLDNQPFVFSGIVNQTTLTGLQKARVSTWVNKIVKEYGLAGLNSLDFIQDGDDSYVLEVNARPPASMQLYAGDLFALHIQARRGGSIEIELPQQSVTGYQIVYAPHSCRIPEDMTWLEGAMDLPLPGSEINTGQPICSIIAQGASADTVRNALNDKQAYILNQLPDLTHGLHRQR